MNNNEINPYRNKTKFQGVADAIDSGLKLPNNEPTTQIIPMPDGRKINIKIYYGTKSFDELCKDIAQVI